MPSIERPIPFHAPFLQPNFGGRARADGGIVEGGLFRNFSNVSIPAVHLASAGFPASSGPAAYPPLYFPLVHQNSPPPNVVLSPLFPSSSVAVQPPISPRDLAMFDVVMTLSSSLKRQGKEKEQKLPNKFTEEHCDLMAPFMNKRPSVTLTGMSESSETDSHAASENVQTESDTWSPRDDNPVDQPVATKDEAGNCHPGVQLPPDASGALDTMVLAAVIAAVQAVVEVLEAE
ncbi:hypothetical protein R1sor_005131 [Riccia sorocarpa]|uniref:Uncharacterized protein n=1 Tax=Riccia sorocarpa TaxID=122646 RepID=A0ABD3HMF5_9MARC